MRGLPLLVTLLAFTGCHGDGAPGDAPSDNARQAAADRLAHTPRPPTAELPVITPRDSAARPTWIAFRDRGEMNVEDALQRRATELHPRALARRQRTRGDRGVDVRDLPVAPEYLEAVIATGALPRRTSRWLNAASVQATPAQIEAIEALPFVRGIHPVKTAPVDLQPIEEPSPLFAEEADYGGAWTQLNLIGVPELHDCGLTGEGVVIGVQDTGFRLTHPAFATTEVLGAYDFLNDDEVVANEEGDPGSQDSHGTMVLSLITGWEDGTYRGVAPDAAVYLTKTEDVSVEQPFEEDRYVEGLEWIEAQGADIFTASLGYIDWYETDDLDGETAVTTIAVEIAVENGLIVFAPMGNAGPGATTLIAPADARAAISVGATNLQGAIANFSSRGPTADGRIKPDVAAPGASVTVARPGNATTYRRGNGTSFATPITAGVAALLLQAYPNLTPQGMAQLLTSTASQPDNPDNNLGHGLIDAYAAAELYCTCTDSDEDFFFDAECGGRDCADDNPDAFPGGEEVCDGADNDCNDATDDGLVAPVATQTQGVCAGQVQVCDGANGWIEPDYGAIEGYEAEEQTCDGRDNDCDGEADNGLTPPPADRQLGVCAGSVRVCSGGDGWTEPNYAAIDAYEEDELTCDGLDNDCDGETDEGLEAPLADVQEGICEGAARVCAGTNGWIEPDYTQRDGHETDEITCDGRDNDCDGSVDEALIAPLADNQNGACAGAIRVCAGAEGWIEPDYSEREGYEAEESTCDGRDNDCDGETDETLTPPAADNQRGVCAGSVRVCAAEEGWVEPDYAAIEGFESDEVSCDGLDNDCDDVVDENLEAPAASRGAGVCQGAIRVCAGAGGWVEPDYTAIEGFEDEEHSCDGLDNDCDGETDEELQGERAARYLGVCLGAVQVCDGSDGWVEPDYEALEGYETDETACDGIDNDCDGDIDESPDCDRLPDAGCEGDDCHEPDACLGDDCEPTTAVTPVGSGCDCQTVTAPATFLDILRRR